MNTPMNLLRQTLFPLLLLTAQCLGQEVPSYYTAQLSTVNATAGLTVNGFPVARLPDEGTEGARGILIGAFLKQGSNEIEIEVAPMSDAGGMVLKQHSVTLECFKTTAIGTEGARLLLVNRATDLEDEQPNQRTELRKADGVDTLLRGAGGGASSVVTWNAGSGELRRQVVGPVEKIVVLTDLPDATLATLPWQAPKPDLDAVAITAIRGKVAALHAALVARNWTEVEGLLDAKLERQAAAFGIPRNQVFAGTVATLDEIFFSAGFVLAAINPADLAVAGVGDLNLFKVTLNGGDPIRGQGEEFTYSMALWFSRVNDEWVVVE